MALASRITALETTERKYKEIHRWKEGRIAALTEVTDALPKISDAYGEHENAMEALDRLAADILDQPEVEDDKRKE